MTGVSRWGLFVDGENLVARYQAMVRDGRTPLADVIHIPDVFVWSKGVTLSGGGQPLRCYYYASVSGDQLQYDSTYELIKDTGVRGPNTTLATFYPRLFRKSKKETRSKGVDIQLCTDILTHVHRDHIDRVLLISGDADYLPLIEEIIHSGKTVQTLALSSGLSTVIKRNADDFGLLDKRFFAPVTQASG